MKRPPAKLPPYTFLSRHARHQEIQKLTIELLSLIFSIAIPLSKILCAERKHNDPRQRRTPGVTALFAAAHPPRGELSAVAMHFHPKGHLSQTHIYTADREKQTIALLKGLLKIE